MEKDINRLSLVPTIRISEWKIIYVYFLAILNE